MTLLIAQVTFVLLVSLACGWIARRLGQARVVGEIAGGILIGPSVLGRFAPVFAGHIFPLHSLGQLETLSTVGLILFLFLIGAELDYGHLREQRGTAALASISSIALPFAMASIAAPAIYRRFAMPGSPFLPFLLFLGISLSITAFPVLARILQERGMQATPLGAAAMMCAAVDDVAAWSLLAVALTLLPSAGGSVSLWYRLLWLGGYLAVMLFAVRPLGGWIARRHRSTGLSYELLGVILAVVFGSAAATDAIGIHPLFGAFLAGLCFPRIPRWQEAVRSRLDTVISLVLLPLFFALTGLRTRLDLLSGRSVWFWTGVLLVLAVGGKMGGAIAGARWTGRNWHDATALGALMNTRDLVELVVLNIAFDAHVFSATLFTILVVMALVTTAITAPVLNWLKVGRGEAEELPVELAGAA